MADPQLEILKSGVQKWNAWREKNPDTLANLSDAHLSGTNLSGASLSAANLSEADLSGADLSQAQLWEAVFGNTDLRNVTGLDSCSHEGPSTLDHRTLMRSGQLPLVFLRG